MEGEESGQTTFRCERFPRNGWSVTSHSEGIAHTAACPPISLLNAEIHCDRGHNLDRQVVQQSWLVSPLTDGIDGGFSKIRIAAHDSRIKYGPIQTD